MNEKRVVMVTGASQGIGAELARWLAKIGCGVVMAARSTAALAEVKRDVERLGGRPLSLTLDVADYEQCRKGVEETLEYFGRLDALVNNAGVLEPISAAADADPQQWRENIEINLLGPFYMFRASAPALRSNRGRVVNISSGAAVNPIGGWSAYCAAKAGLTHLTRVVAEEEPDLTVMALRPGVVDTQLQTLIREKGSVGMKPEKVAYFKDLKTGGHLEPPAVPARAAAWLALHAPREWSGEYVEYDDPRISEPAKAVFGDENCLD